MRSLKDPHTDNNARSDGIAARIRGFFCQTIPIVLYFFPYESLVHCFFAGNR